MKRLSSQHAVLIGFKSAGKSVIGREVARRLQKPFYDLDHHVESRFAAATGESLTCRQIMIQQGEACFREIETEVLQDLLKHPPAIISLGGGTPLSLTNQALLKGSLIIHVIAPEKMIYDRILRDGLPAFFGTKEAPDVVFSRLWNERNKIYTRLATISLLNDRDIHATVNDLTRRISP